MDERTNLTLGDYTPAFGTRLSEIVWVTSVKPAAH